MSVFTNALPGSAVRSFAKGLQVYYRIDAIRYLDANMLG